MQTVSQNVVKMPGNQDIDYGESVTDQALAKLQEETKTLLMNWDGKDFEVIRKAKMKRVKIRTSLKPLKDKYNAAALAHQRIVNSEYNRIIDTVTVTETPLDEILDAEKARVDAEKAAKIEADRKQVEAIQGRIAYIRNQPTLAINKSAAEIKKALDDLNAFLARDTFNYEELHEDAAQAKLDTFAKLAEMLKGQLEIENAKAAEKAALEAQRRAQDEEDKRLAAEREKFAEEQRAARFENERIARIQGKIATIKMYPSGVTQDLRHISLGISTFEENERDIILNFDFMEFQEEAEQAFSFVHSELTRMIVHQREKDELTAFREAQRWEREEQEAAVKKIEVEATPENTANKLVTNVALTQTLELEVEDNIYEVSEDPANAPEERGYHPTPEETFQDECNKVANSMIENGGSFVEALGKALMKADKVNCWKIKTTWSDYWEQYINIPSEAYPA